MKRQPAWHVGGLQAMVINRSKTAISEFTKLANEIDRHNSLRDVLAWAATQSPDEVHPQFVAEVITQDEFTHDVIVPYRNVFLVYDTT